MITKSLIAVAAVAASMTFLAPTNEAKAGGVDIDVNLGIGGFHPGYGHGYGYGYGYPVYDDYHRGISCSKGRKIVRHSGFRNVTAIDCHGPSYQYRAWKHGNPYKVRVNAYGDITRVRPL